MDLRMQSGVNMRFNDLASAFQGGLVNGGPSALIYGLLTSWLGSIAVSASLAEMASM